MRIALFTGYSHFRAHIAPTFAHHTFPLSRTYRSHFRGYVNPTFALLAPGPATPIPAARTLHRLGGHILQVIAAGNRPYQETPDARSKEIGAAVGALHAAGIVRRKDALRQKNWAVTDPRVTWGLGLLTGGPADEQSADTTHPDLS
jgi:hypothetical protein